jgi:hypothetical protein
MSEMARQKGIKVSAISIHEDPPEDAVEHASDVEETEADGASDSEMSVDEPMSDEEVEDTVAEDMNRLEMTFEGISDRYRLINRIGEGLSPSLTCKALTLQVPFRPCTKPKTCIMENTKTAGTQSKKTSGHAPNVRNATRPDTWPSRRFT